MPKIKNIKNVLLVLVVLLISGCSGFFEKDNTPSPTPLMPFRQEVSPSQIWSTRVGFGSGSEYLKMTPATDTTSIYTTSTNGTVTAVTKQNGVIRWQITSGLSLSAGPGAGDGMVVVASRKGEVLALCAENGSKLWKVNVAGEVLAQPAIGYGIVIIKTIDGGLIALSQQNGHELWTYQVNEPNLILRGSSSPLLRDHTLFAGFANGSLSKFNLHEGQPIWTQFIAVPEGAFPIQRMIDIDADPLIYHHRVFAATYQGKIASLEWGSGRFLWTHDISSYTGMIADDESLYITDAKSHVWSFNSDTGLVNWRQCKLEARGITGPASIAQFIVVGDAGGYLHWLDKRDGRFVGRTRLGAAIYAAPIAENNVLYALASNGELTAYMITF